MKPKSFINRLIKMRGYKDYLEIGLLHGDTFRNIKCARKVGVDPVLDPRVDRSLLKDSAYVELHEVISNDYFAISDEVDSYKGDFDVIFLDGLRIDEQVSSDIFHATKRLRESGIIIVQACNPHDENSQLETEIASPWFGTVWKAFVKFRKYNWRQYYSCTVDTSLGLGIIKKGLSSQAKSIVLPKDLTFEWFDKNRGQALNLMHKNKFFKIMKELGRVH